MYEDLVLYAVKYAEGLGAKYAEARYHRIASNTVISRNGLVIGAGKEVSEGIGVRVLVDGALAFTSTDKLDKESIRLVVEKAYSMAKAQSRLMKKPIELADARMGRARYSVVEKKPFDSLSIDEKTRLHNELWGIVSKSVSEARVPVFFMNYIESVE